MLYVQVCACHCDSVSILQMNGMYAWPMCLVPRRASAYVLLSLYTNSYETNIGQHEPELYLPTESLKVGEQV